MKYPFSPLIKEIEVLSSKFIACLYPLDDKDDVKKLEKEVRERFPKATHYPFAYRLLPLEGMSDDGEPKGSTGLPLLDIMRQKEVDKVIVFVVRYFGGRKLGLPRLTRTYREALSLALDNMEEAIFIPIEEVSLETDYGTYEALKKDSKRLSFSLEVKEFSLLVKLVLLIDANIMNVLLEQYGNKLKNVSIEEKIIRRKIDHENLTK